MQITTQIDVLGLVDQTAKAQKNLVYSAVQGINRTAQMIQDAQRKALEKDFTLRTPQSKDFLTRRVAVIRPFASVNQGRLYADVSMNSKAARPVLLPGFESGEQRKPARGKLIAAPVVGGPARPNFNDPVKDQFMFKNLRLRAKKTAGGRVFTGQSGTYSVPKVGVFRRLGSGNSELVYAFVQRQKLPAKLGWQQRAQAVADRWLSENITQAFMRTLPKRFTP